MFRLRSSTIVPIVLVGGCRAEKLLKYLEGTFDEYFEEEQRVHRNPKYEEHRIHSLLYLIEPTGLGLKQFDADFMKCLAPRINIIPVIAKADGLDEAEKRQSKKRVSTASASLTCIDHRRHSEQRNPNLRLCRRCCARCRRSRYNPSNPSVHRHRRHFSAQRCLKRKDISVGDRQLR